MSLIVTQEGKGEDNKEADTGRESKQKVHKQKRTMQNRSEGECCAAQLTVLSTRGIFLTILFKKFSINPFQFHWQY